MSDPVGAVKRNFSHVVRSVWLCD